MPSLKGTQTEKNLMAAFAGESQARNRYTFAASASAFISAKRFSLTHMRPWPLQYEQRTAVGAFLRPFPVAILQTSQLWPWSALHIFSPWQWGHSMRVSGIGSPFHYRAGEGTRASRPRHAFRRGGYYGCFRTSLKNSCIACHERRAAGSL